MYQFLLILLSLFIIKCNTPPTKTKPSKPKLELSKLDQAIAHQYDSLVLEQFLRKQAPVGLGVAIVNDGKILLKKGYGLKTNGTSDSVDVHTVFRIASLSKGFASVLGAKLVDEKKLKWNSKVKDYIDDFELSEEDATDFLNLKHVLSQSTGLPRHSYGNLIERGKKLETMIHMLREVDLNAFPGEVMAYQNVAYSLVQPMYEKATGMTYDSLIQQYIYKPLKMNDASVDYESLMVGTNVAQPHRYRTGRRIRQDDEYFEVLPAAGINASISDMANWLNALLGYYPDAFTKEALAPIYQERNTLPRNNPWSRSWKRLGKVGVVGYAMGWRTINYNGHDIIYHGGYLNGYRAEMAFSLEENTGIVALSNSNSNFLIKTVPKYFDLYFKEKEKNNSSKMNAPSRPISKMH